MKLFEVPCNTEIQIVGDPDETIYMFHHIDGAYSYCVEYSTGDVVHLSANTEVRLFWQDYYSK